MKKKNIWKIAFITLSTINTLFIVSLAVILFFAMEQKTIPESANLPKNTSDFIIQTDKQDLNKLINYYIEREGLNGAIDYQVFLTDEVELYGEVQVFSETLQLKMTFEPRALENGDLLLEQKTLSLGKVKLPVAYILKFIDGSYQFPPWVIIQPNDKQIYVALHKLSLSSGIHIRAEEFNLVDNQISLKMLVPTE